MAVCHSDLFYQTKFEIASLIVHWGQESSLQNRRQRKNHRRMTIYLSSLNNISLVNSFRPRTGNVVLIITHLTWFFNAPLLFFEHTVQNHFFIWIFALFNWSTKGITWKEKWQLVQLRQFKKRSVLLLQISW